MTAAEFFNDLAKALSQLISKTKRKKAKLEVKTSGLFNGETTTIDKKRRVKINYKMRLTKQDG